MSKSKKNKQVSRRQVIQQSTLGLGMGMGLMDMYTNLIPAQLRKAISLGSHEALAQAQTVPGGRKHPVIQICLIDKIQQALLLETDGAVAAFNNPDAPDKNAGLDGAGQNYNGVDISGEALAFTDFRGMSMTQLFGGRLGAMAAGYNMAVLPKVDSQAGGHNMNGSPISAELGGLNNVIQSAGTDPKNLLGYVGFNVGGDANDSREGALGLNGLPLPTFSGVSTLRTTLRNSIAPLTASEKSLNFRRQLDALATKDKGVFATLLQIKDRIDPAVNQLQAALTAANAVEQQFAAAKALWQTGLCNNFMICIPWDDTNQGSLTTTGGDLGYSPYVGFAMLADLYVKISQEMPEAITVIVSDGGRANNNGDSAGGMSIITGPATLVNNGQFGDKVNHADLGSVNAMRNLGTAYKMSRDADLGVLRHRNVLSLVAKLVDIDVDTPFPVVGISPKSDVG